MIERRSCLNWSCLKNLGFWGHMKNCPWKDQMFILGDVPLKNAFFDLMIWFPLLGAPIEDGDACFWIRKPLDLGEWKITLLLLMDKILHHKDDDYPIIYRVWTIPVGAGFLPSTVGRRFFKDFFFRSGSLGFHDPIWLEHIFQMVVVKNHQLATS